MSAIDAIFLWRCIASLERARNALESFDDEDDIFYHVFRAACVKEFELVLEQSGNLLRNRIAFFYANNSPTARLTFKDLFRYAARHGLLGLEEIERWFEYRDR